jgi:hypothetical protein
MGNGKLRAFHCRRLRRMRQRESSFGNLDRRRALRCLFGAENPYQSAECADDEGYRAKQQRNVYAFICH